MTAPELIENLVKAIQDSRAFIAGMLKGNIVYSANQWEKGYCAGIVSALDHFDRITKPALAIPVPEGEDVEEKKPLRCTDCRYDPPEMEPDKDCMCGGAQTLAAQLSGYRGCIQWWRDQHSEALARIAALEAEKARLLEDITRRDASPIYGHIVPVQADLDANAAKQPLGEEIRKSLIEWLEQNQIVSLWVDTPRHNVRVDIAKLPPRIKHVLTLWGSIFVNDSEDATIQEADKR